MISYTLRLPLAFASAGVKLLLSPCALLLEHGLHQVQCMPQTLIVSSRVCSMASNEVPEISAQ
jgi:hypothetical protein